MTPATLQRLADRRTLADLLALLHRMRDDATLHAHWLQGEFHHDLVFELETDATALVVSTNCNGGIKDVLHFAAVPERWALWHMRCPDNPEFDGEPPALLAEARTEHWFDPCEILADDARSELRPELRQRQRGGGWRPLDE